MRSRTLSFQPSCLILLVSAAVLASWNPVNAQDIPSIDEKTRGFDQRKGFVTAYWDDEAGKVWLEISRLGEDFLYLESLPHGLGSNDIGLDRGQAGTRLVVRFERYGPKVLMVAPNLRYRASGAPDAEARSVGQAFAEGVIWGFEVAAETDGRLLVDATDFIVRDAHGVVQTLKRTNQGTFAMDVSRSSPVPDALKSFPDNTELEARLTFTSEEPGRYVRDVAAVPGAFSVRVRHSLVRLPGPGYEPRAFHPRSGFFGPSYQDYAVPIGEDMTVRHIARHRLEKKDPGAAVSEVVKPIIYHLDPGTPEPIRSALLDGARWWAAAFDAAGFRDAFRVEMLPEDADPLDVRYNVIQWVHRATRGWSYGDAIYDPRTGEIIKGHVSLGSLRVRQDYLIAEGLLAPYSGELKDGVPSDDDPMLDMALARIRQLSAHEVGHTIGLAHNFAASVKGRASVMDYPAPLAALTDGGEITLDRAYDTGIGEWDILAIRYGYGTLPAGTSEAEYLRGVLDDAREQGLAYITDQDARPSGAALPQSNLWDNGSDMIESLRTEMDIRRIALDRFGEAVVRSGRPLALVEEALVPLYLRHRYQVEATTKLLGGVYYSYATRGDASSSLSAVDGESQRRALGELLRTVQPATLRVPAAALLIPPRPFGYEAHRELFVKNTAPVFDPYTPAETAATMVFSLLLDRARAARLVYQADFDESLPSFAEVLERTAQSLLVDTQLADEYEAEIRRLTQGVWIDALLDLAGDGAAAAAVTSRASAEVRRLREWLSVNPGREAETLAHRAALRSEIDRFLNRAAAPVSRRTEITIPPGSPIGTAQDDWSARVRRRLQRLVDEVSPYRACTWGLW